ncbi:hypothetical protein D9M70_574500 [compost metagenome]
MIDFGNCEAEIGQMLLFFQRALQIALDMCDLSLCNAELVLAVFWHKNPGWIVGC